MTSIEKTDLGKQMRALRIKLADVKHTYDSAQGRYKACEKKILDKHGFICPYLFPELDRRREDVNKIWQKILGIHSEMRKVTNQKKKISYDRRKMMQHSVHDASVSNKITRVFILKDYVNCLWIDAIDALSVTPNDAYVSPLICDAKKRWHIWLEYADCAPDQYKAVSRTIHEKMHADIADWKQMVGL
jgi:hypothetical protein